MFYLDYNWYTSILKRDDNFGNSTLTSFKRFYGKLYAIWTVLVMLELEKINTFQKPNYDAISYTVSTCDWDVSLGSIVNNTGTSKVEISMLKAVKNIYKIK